MRVLFVGFGDVCRSPLAAALFRARLGAAGLSDRVEVDSAGTGDWHIGGPPDARMQAAAARRGTDLSGRRARQLVRADLDRFDHALAMDRATLHDTLWLDPDGDHGTRVRLLREFDPEPGDYEVPDPDAGGPAEFEAVYETVDRAVGGLLARLRAAYGV